ncbi:rCG35647 [Rattus norvegicus]|uniref:RCG35647 n=1 Tax=Rattus norvegicus TaxID=10116 RepID=A6KF74_RAT|nr:rCG35647 [Rattus norvegicus]
MHIRDCLMAFSHTAAGVLTFHSNTASWASISQ